MKLRTKIVIVILQIALVPWMVGGAIAYTSAKEQIRAKTYADLDAFADIQKNRLQDTLQNKLDILHLLSTSPWVIATVHEYNARPSTTSRREMQEIIEAPGKTLGIVKTFIVANNGDVVASTDSAMLGMNVKDEEYFKLGSQADEESILKKDANGIILHYLAGPLISDGRTEGVMVVVTDAEDIVSISQDYTGLGNTGETLLVKRNSEGDALFLTPTRFNPDAALSLVVASGRLDVPAVQAVAGKEAVFANLVDYRGVSVSAATRYLPDAGWGIVVKVNQSEALAPIEKLEELFFFIIAMTGMLMAIIGISVSRSITDPIHELTLLADKVAAGSLQQEIAVVTKDEVGMLATAFNSMVLRLREAYSMLESKVSERTKELVERTQEARNSERAALNIASDLKDEEEKLAEEKAKAEALANDLKKFKLALDNASDQVYITDPEGIMLYANAAIEKVSGYKPEEAIGKKAGALWKTPMPLPYYQKLWHTIKVEKKVFLGEIQNRRKNGQLYTAMLNISPVVNAEGEVIFFVGLERDITREKEIDEAKSEFISLASHQMRTPLTSINWYTEMLLGGDAGKLTKKQADYFEAIYAAGQQMNEIIKSFLHILRLETGTLVMKPVSVDLTTIMQSILKELHLEIKKKSLHVTEHYPKKTPSLVIDQEIVRVVLQNIVSNAAKYTPEKGDLVVSVESVSKGAVFAGKTAKHESLAVSVQDTGIGIAEKDSATIFSKFFRSEDAKRWDPNGNGLGLYMTKKMVDMLGGNIWFVSEAGKGTTFHVLLPVEKKK